MWIAIDRKSKQVIDYMVTYVRSKNQFTRMYNRLRKLKIKNLHTDACSVYSIINKKYNPTITKDQTTQVESFNSVLRHYLPFLCRKTKMYSKCIYMLISKLDTFLYLHNKNIKNYLDLNKLICTFASTNQLNVDTLKLSKNGFGW